MERKSIYTTVCYGVPLNVYRTGSEAQIGLWDDVGRGPRSLRNVHTHFTYEIFFCTEGSLELISEKGNGVFQQRVVIIPPHISHCSYPSGDGSFCLLFSLEGGTERNRELRQKITQILSGNICNFPITDEICFYIKSFAENDRIGFESDAEHLLGLIFNAVFRALLPMETNSLPPDHVSRHINAIEEYINTHLFEKITLKLLSEKFFLSGKQISRIIQKEYDCSLAKLLMLKKLDVAETLLKNSDLSIAQIAEQVCVGSENYFYKLFKDWYGVSPLQYRKKYLS